MKVIKKTLVIILSLIVLLSIVSLFFSTEVKVSKSVSIKAPVETVFANVSTMNNWNLWGGPWHEEGMDFKKVIQRFEDSEFGFGKKLIYNQGMGEGSVEVMEMQENKSVKTLITFADGATANGEWYFEESEGSVNVTWGLHVHLGYNPLKRIMGNIMLGGKVGPLFEKGLSNLKEISEN